MEQKPTKPTFQIPFGNYSASLDKGVWRYDPIQKSQTSIPAKAMYKDPAQYKIMEEYETISKSRYQGQLGKMAMEIVGHLKNI
jgi:hypothetical protein